MENTKKEVSNCIFILLVPQPVATVAGEKKTENWPIP
jgi:hypothetical protein